MSKPLFVAIGSTAMACDFDFEVCSAWLKTGLFWVATA
jgi:hypothetical protein